ncbi:hypothetical protein BKA67DRAFT_515368 [Truncatella angustata]|uniref:Polyketide synthase n=1 Tax=Truncatella angustata TaxID=152316 RepID=A0A9P8UQ05_9PEZI|nr:uncharacterized protein BKA67DRAFT_515368 [Truncatella angustata]KAH6656006.1 hypothetical protein BKA67DRAFT_515368 [Truncatella angustata]
MAPHSTVDYEASHPNGYHNGINGTNGVNGGSPHVTNGVNGHAHPTAALSPEPIAIIGIGCRLPGGCDSSTTLWDLLASGRSAQGPIPNSRFNVDGFYHPNVDRPGSMNTTGGYFIDEDIRGFENSFFGINNLEAMYMDPQQRKLLEVVFECLENAGVTLEQASGANIGCYVGNFVTDFITMQLKDPEYVHRYTATGLGTTILANRISHAFNLKGPSFVLDTACSSSLYCLHVACSALWAGECTSALVAGANLIQSPDQHLGTMKAGVLSKTSTCHTFDSSADGYGRAEGVGVLLVKKLSDAIRDGDTIRSVIRGTAINSNGKTNGITLPSADGQEAVIRKAYDQAGLDYYGTQYVECHGTGTAVGDPIEVEALSRVFQRPKGSPLLIGSVKTNLGHSEAASGISSIIKVTLALEKGQIPPTVGVKQINPKIKTDDWNVKIVTETAEWPWNKHDPRRSFRRASINSFGYGGANAHCIIESAEMHVPRGYKNSSEAIPLARTTMLLPFSATNIEALKHRVTDLAKVLDSRVISTADAAYTLGTKRSHLPVRGFLLAGHTLHKDLSIDNLRLPIEGKSYSKFPLAFVFTGQGAQWAQMGFELMEEFPSFRRSIQRLDSALQTLPHAPTWTLQGAILEPAETSTINQASRSQPVCTAIQIALIQLLAQWGIHPSTVLGHSSGEIAAAYAAGHISSEQAIAFAYYRGYVVAKSKMVGAMMAAGLGQAEATAKIEELGLSTKIRVACVNSPSSTTISGDVDGINLFKEALDSNGTFARLLKTDGKAYHSHHMTVVGDEYENLLESAMLHLEDGPLLRSDVRFISSVTGNVFHDSFGPDYWRRNLESPVLFSSAVEQTIKIGSYHMVEIGPHSALELPIKQIRSHLNINESKAHYGSVLSRGKNSITTVLNLIGDLYLHGHEISFKSVNFIDSSIPKRKVSGYQGTFLNDLPNYRWNYDDVVFNEPRASVEWRTRKHKRHDLLGSMVLGDGGLIKTWRNILKSKDVPWIEGHKLDHTTVFPAAGYIAMAIEAISQITQNTSPSKPGFIIRDVKILKAFPLPQEENSPGTELFTTLHPVESETGTWHQFTISTFDLGQATIHSSGLIKLDEATTSIKRSLGVDEKLMEPSAPRTWYKRFTKAGLNYQDKFQCLTEIQCHGKRELMHTHAKTGLLQGGGEGLTSESDYVIHPVTIDGLLQAGIIASTAGQVNKLDAKVPVQIEQIRIHSPTVRSGETMSVDAISVPMGFGTIKISAELYNDVGQVFMQIDQCRAVVYNSGTQQAPEDERHPMLRVLWKPDITTFASEDQITFSNFIQKFASTFKVQGGQPGEIGIAAALDLICHKDPKLHVLNLWPEADDFLTELLRLETPFRRSKGYTSGFINEEGEVFSQVAPSSGEAVKPLPIPKDQAFNVIIISTAPRPFDKVVSLLADKGTILLNGTVPESERFGGRKFTTLQSQNVADQNVTLVQLQEESSSTTNDSERDVFLVERDPDHELNTQLALDVSRYTGRPVHRISLDKVTPAALGPRATVIATVELQEALLSNMSSEEMALVKNLTDNASVLIWLTGGGLFAGAKPEFAVVYGLSRALMLEQPSLRFFTIDVDPKNIDLKSTGRNVVKVLQQVLESPAPDFEFIQDSGALHISRFVPDETSNRTFRRKQGLESLHAPLAEVKPGNFIIGAPGQLDSILFESEQRDEGDLPSGHVKVDVKAVGLTPQDLDVFTGDSKVAGTSSSSQFTGVVTAIGTNVTSLAPGDRVVVLAPGRFATTEQVPDWACQKLVEGEDLTIVSSIPVPFITALYAIHHQAHLENGDSVLISCGTELAGVIAIRIAQKVGAEVFVVAPENLKADLVSLHGLSPDNVFETGDAAVLEKVLRKTDGNGVDAVLDFNSRQPFPDSLTLSAGFGRLVRIGQKANTSNLSATSNASHKNVAIFNLDIAYLLGIKSSAGRKVLQRLFADAIALYREDNLHLDENLQIFNVDRVADAFRSVASKSAGGVVVSFQVETSVVKTIPLKYTTNLSPDKVYIMVGCLGGLGRSISKWMVKRGARKFVFMGRTGTDRAPARRLVDDLSRSGAKVTVIRGDVVNYADVDKAIKAADGPIGGVIQAAMGLDEALFTTMSSEYWHTGLAPKLTGTWNLHNALHGQESELDFFLMTSSVSGSVGTATEGNYCSANYFLDVFARYRRHLGLSAISVGLGMISEVGYLHENPEIEALLIRKGIQAINEDEMLQIIDVSISSKWTPLDDYDSLAHAHVLTGLEPLGLKELRAKGFEGTSPVMGDPRASLLSAAIDDQDDGSNNAANSGLPAEVAQALESGESLENAVLKALGKKFSNLVLVAADKLDTTKPINDIGVDSMLAAEFRGWLFQIFQVDVPFLTLLSNTTTLLSLAELVTKSIETA